jgi:Flavodoxin reductases (ferredoxin-NADPH reductases) family 1
MKDLNIHIKPIGLFDLLAFKKLAPARKEKIAAAPAAPIDTRRPVNVLAEKLHPERQFYKVTEVRKETPTAKTFRLAPDADMGTKELALFLPGQYLPFWFELEEATVSRPYSISSSPAEARAGFYEITVKKNQGGFVSNFIFSNWKKGSKAVSGAPAGGFYYQSLRDRKNVAGIAGGSGAAPFRSMIKCVLDGSLDIDLTLFFGSTTTEEALYIKEFREAEAKSGGKIKIVHALSCEEKEGCEKGFISAEMIKKYVNPADSSFFICGPQAMYEFLEKELEAFKLPQKFIRREHFGEIKNPSKFADYKGKPDSVYKIAAHMGRDFYDVPASGSESVLVALERAGLKPPSSCRSGSCGVCRSLLIKGDVFIPKTEDGRREADKQFGFIHPCSSFPLTDLEIVIPQAR